MRKIKLLCPFLILALFSIALFNSCKKESSDALNSQTQSAKTLLLQSNHGWMNKKLVYQPLLQEKLIL
jgi:hypothetical protein